jgi:hypothetical protein
MCLYIYMGSLLSGGYVTYVSRLKQWQNIRTLCATNALAELLVYTPATAYTRLRTHARTATEPLKTHARTRAHARMQYVSPDTHRWRIVTVGSGQERYCAIKLDRLKDVGTINRVRRAVNSVGLCQTFTAGWKTMKKRAVGARARTPVRAWNAHTARMHTYITPAAYLPLRAPHCPAVPVATPRLTAHRDDSG